MEIHSGTQIVVVYSYYLSQILLVGGLAALAWRQRNAGFLVATVAFGAFLIGNVEMVWASHSLDEARQRLLDLTPFENTYAAWRLVSAGGFLIGSLSVVGAAIFTPRSRAR